MTERRGERGDPVAVQEDLKAVVQIPLDVHEHPTATARDFELMREALKEAHVAFHKGEVPVGCVIARDGEIIARGQNKPNQTKDATTHAEFVAIDVVVEREGDSYVFHDCDLYVTVEPCIMCASALLILGFRRVFFGCSNQRFGGCGSVLALCDKDKL
jgi:tRNA-specific adenosine deaminase 2